MNGRQDFSAPWGRALKVVSGCAVLVCIGVAVTGVASGGLLTLLFPLFLVLAVPFIVRGYAIEGNTLLIQRVGWAMKIPLDGLELVEIVPNAMRRALRLFGNGGLFSITGLYRNKALGNFRSFANDMKRTVVLRFEKRTIVVSPDDPAGFARAIQSGSGRFSRLHP